MEPRSQAQYQRMTETPIPKLITSLAVPTIISMMVTSIYNMADTFFVSKLGTSAAGAVGVVFSMMAIIQAVGFTMGMGAGSNISRLLGEKRDREANRFASSAFFGAIAIGLAVMAVGLTLTDPLMRLLGATETILPFAADYGRYIFFGAPVMCGAFVLNNILRSEGKAALSMVGIGLGGLLNILLDPIFIFVLGMGISGAAIATLLSQCVSFCILLSFFLTGKSASRLRIGEAFRELRVYGVILKTGLPTLCRQGLASAASVALNVTAAPYGDAAVAAMSIVGRIVMFVQSIMVGFGQGFQPVAGFNFGAAKYGRVRKSFWFEVKVGFVGLALFAVAGFCFAPQILALFRADDPEVIQIGAFALRCQCLVIPLSAVSTITNMLLQCTGRSWSATFIASARQGVFYLPLVVILNSAVGLTGVQIAQPVSDLLTFVCCIPLLRRYFRYLTTLEQQAAVEPGAG